MKVTLIANLSANGQVLLAGNPKHEAPNEALGFFVQQANLKGNLIIGKTTFDVLQQFPGGIKAIFPNVVIVLLSQSLTKIEGYTVVSDPVDAIKYLSGKGFQEIIVGGGARTYTSFLEKDLITDVYFNFIPIIIGDGGVIGNSSKLNVKFNSIEQKQLTNDIVQIHLSKG